MHDLGPGFDHEHVPPHTDAPGGRGLFIAGQLADDLEVRRRHTAGSSVTARLPVQRAPTVDHAPAAHRTSRLPPLSAAAPAGFGRETFLLALAVQLAMTTEERHGPDAAEALVAQVGTDVGAQMETEFRAATGLAGPLTNAEVAACLVRLKDAIDGGFHVLEIDDTRIVLGNTRCPFGDLVRRAPSLCRMTSSVFGAIAASSTGRDVTVDLQERIALGDTSCRVVIDFGAQPGSFGHRYRPPSSPPFERRDTNE